MTTDITELAQRVPERKRHDWSQSVMRDCDFCNQWSLTVKHEDGARICASCCDAEYTSKLEVANSALVEALEKAQAKNALVAGGIEAAAKLHERIAELESFHTAYMEWSAKTDWVQTDKRFDVLKPWGKHRADVLKAYIEHLESRTFTAAAADVLAERHRQVTAEGWAPAHDDEYEHGELADAAGCYALSSELFDCAGEPPRPWPWPDEWWKPTSRRRDLVKAGALILAEIERIDRAAGIKVEGE